MFDGLKDKLGSFREDVEEQAELEEVDEDDLEEAASDEAAAESDPDDTGAEADAASPESTAESDAEADADAGLAARAKALATGKVIIDEDDLEGPLWDLEMALLESDVEMSVAEAILEDVKAELVGERKGAISSTSALVEDALRDALLEVISVGQFDFEQRIAEAEKPVVIVFTGVNGVGKTTSIAKLSEWLEERGFSSVLANGDTYRAGANEQIREHAEALDRKLIAHEQGGDPAAVIYDGVEYAEANDIDVVLGDTAGRLHTSNDLMAQLEKIDRVVDPDMTIFVDEAVAGQDAVERAKQFDEAAAIDGAILTKADADSQGGAAISIAHVTGKPILFLGTGQGYDDIQRFDPERLVEQLLEE
jgi:fused signal recognition particle receptor